MKPRNNRTKRLLAVGITVFIVVLLALLVSVRTMQTAAEEQAASFEAQNLRLETEKGVMAVQLEEADTTHQGLLGQLENLTDELAQAHVENEETAGTLETTQQELAEMTTRHTALQQTAKALNEELKALKKTKAATVIMPSRGGWDKKESAPKSTPQSTVGAGQVVGNNFEATWYNITGTTRSGRQTQDGVTVAVDPNVIPLGSLLRITFPNGQVYERVAQDTGGVVKGHIIDLYSSASTSELLRRGRTHGVKVEILRRGW